MGHKTLINQFYSIHYCNIMPK